MAARSFGSGIRHRRERATSCKTAGAPPCHHFSGRNRSNGQTNFRPGERYISFAPSRLAPLESLLNERGNGQAGSLRACVEFSILLLRQPVAQHNGASFRFLFSWPAAFHAFNVLHKIRPVKKKTLLPRVTHPCNYVRPGKTQVP